MDHTFPFLPQASSVIPISSFLNRIHIPPLSLPLIIIGSAINHPYSSLFHVYPVSPFLYIYFYLSKQFPLLLRVVACAVPITGSILIMSISVTPNQNLNIFFHSATSNSASFLLVIATVSGGYNLPVSLPSCKLSLLFVVILLSQTTPASLPHAFRGAVVAKWIRPWTLNHEVPGSNLLAAAKVPLGKELYPHCIFPSERT